MKWILWVVWGIICIPALILSMIVFIICNAILFLWEFTTENMIFWGDFMYEVDCSLEKGTLNEKEIPDKTPWITYKRWVFIND